MNESLLSGVLVPTGSDASTAKSNAYLIGTNGQQQQQQHQPSDQSSQTFPHNIHPSNNSVPSHDNVRRASQQSGTGSAAADSYLGSNHTPWEAVMTTMESTLNDETAWQIYLRISRSISSDPFVATVVLGLLLRRPTENSTMRSHIINSYRLARDKANAFINEKKHDGDRPLNGVVSGPSGHTRQLNVFNILNLLGNTPYIKKAPPDATDAKPFYYLEGKVPMWLIPRTKQNCPHEATLASPSGALPETQFLFSTFFKAVKSSRLTYWSLTLEEIHLFYYILDCIKYLNLSPVVTIQQIWSKIPEIPFGMSLNGFSQEFIQILSMFPSSNDMTYASRLKEQFALLSASESDRAAHSSSKSPGQQQKTQLQPQEISAQTRPQEAQRQPQSTMQYPQLQSRQVSVSQTQPTQAESSSLAGHQHERHHHRHQRLLQQQQQQQQLQQQQQQQEQQQRAHASSSVSSLLSGVIDPRKQLQYMSSLGRQNSAGALEVARYLQQREQARLNAQNQDQMKSPTVASILEAQRSRQSRQQGSAPLTPPESGAVSTSAGLNQAKTVPQLRPKLQVPQQSRESGVSSPTTGVNPAQVLPQPQSEPQQVQQQHQPLIQPFIQSQIPPESLQHQPEAQLAQSEQSQIKESHSQPQSQQSKNAQQFPADLQKGQQTDSQSLQPQKRKSFVAPRQMDFAPKINQSSISHPSNGEASPVQNFDQPSAPFQVVQSPSQLPPKPLSSPTPQNQVQQPGSTQATQRSSSSLGIQRPPSAQRKLNFGSQPRAQSHPLSRATSRSELPVADTQAVAKTVGTEQQQVSDEARRASKPAAIQLSTNQEKPAAASSLPTPPPAAAPMMEDDRINKNSQLNIADDNLILFQRMDGVSLDFPLILNGDKFAYEIEVPSELLNAIPKSSPIPVGSVLFWLTCWKDSQGLIKASWPANIEIHLNGYGVDSVSKKDPIPISHFLREGINLFEIQAFPDPKKKADVNYTMLFQANRTSSVKEIRQMILEHSNEVNTFESCKQAFLNRLQFKENDIEILSKTLEVSLICPLSLSRIRVPIRTVECKHPECFDLDSYLLSNAKSNAWRCPICGKSAQAAQVVEDFYFREIIDKLDPSVTMVAINVDGSYTPAENCYDDGANKKQRLA